MRHTKVVRFLVTVVNCGIILTGFAASGMADEIYHMEQCRVLDTRNLGGPIPNGTELSFKVRGQVGGLYGGTSNCGVPIEASGVMVNVTVVPVGVGHLEVYPTGQRPPLPTSRINYVTGVVIANEMLVRLRQPIDTSLNEVTVRPSSSPTHVIVDLIAWTGEANPTFPIIKGRLVGEPFQEGEFTHIKVETAVGGDCTDPTSCFEIECSNQPGAGEVCFVAGDDLCVEVQGYRRPYSSPQWINGPNRRMVGTIVRSFDSSGACPWED